MSNQNKISFLEEKAVQESKLDQDLIILTVIASLLAVYGVKMNNPYVLIGSMLVSPLFDPVISMVIFYYAKNIAGLKRAVYSFVATLVIAICTSFIFWYVLLFSKQLDHLVYQGTSQSLLDTTVVAILMGIVGTLLWIWPKSSNTSAGAAIAISLVPPIANLTIGIVLGNYDFALAYLTVLLLNLFGIIVGVLIILKIYIHGKYMTRL